MNSLPSNSDVAMQLKQAVACQRQGDLPKAQWLFQQVLAVDPYNFSALDGMGLLLGQAGRFEEALNCFTRASIVQPNEFAVYFNCGTALKELGRHEDALASFDKTLSLNPNFAEAYGSRGSVFNSLGRFDEALASFDQAIVCNAKYANAHNNRGAVLHKIFKRHDEALVSLNKAIALKPRFAEAHYNRALLLSAMGKFDAALASYDRAIQINASYVDANYNKALLLLLLGQYEKGWPLYEWRWKTEQFKYDFRAFKQPLWLGDQALTGKTILLHAEQGFGDLIQIVRYLPMVTALGAKVVLEAPATLMTLLRTLKAEFTLLAKGDGFPSFDLHCPIMSLPLAFRSTVDTIPAAIPYLSAEPDKQLQVQKRRGERVRPRVGLAWSGNPKHLNDRNRSMPLNALKPLLDLDFEYHSLHQQLTQEDELLLDEWGRIQFHGAELMDYSDTAALIAELDLVITVDTSVAHLAGALGKKVWILLPYAPDFRWLMGRDDSPWYATARLFRQGQLGDWDGVIAALRVELQTLSVGA